MLMDLDSLVARYNIAMNDGILHLGGHLAEEADSYGKYDSEVTWVEANPAVIPKIEDVLKNYPKQRVINALVADADGETRPFHITNYDGMSSSLLEFGTHPEFSPDTVFVDELQLVTCTVDALVDAYNIKAKFLVMDLQGAEGMVLAGAKKLLPNIDAVISEVNKKEVYVGCAKIWELDGILREYGLERVETYWVADQGWGDSLWIRQ